MAIITLITDMGTKDHYVAMVKGAILTQHPEAVIVDVTHAIKPFHNSEAVHVLRHAYPAFPEGTIHMVGVNPEADRFTVHVVAKHQGHYFIGADNGILPLAFSGMPDEAYEITMKLDEDHAAFPMYSVFVKAACHLARGGKPETIGRRMTALRELFNIKPTADDKCIVGEVVYIDHYGNVITNIMRPLFDEVRRRRPFRIGFGIPSDDITRLHGTYGDVPNGVCLAFFNASGNLEIAVNKGVEGSGGGAARLLGLRETDPVRIEFTEKTRA